MYVDLRSAVGRGIFATGKFDPAVFLPIAEVLVPGDTFLDVGANVGYYSMLALDAIGPKGRIHAFEIDPRPLKCLRKTIERFELGNLLLHETAAGEKEGVLNFTMREDCGNSSLTTDPSGIKVPVCRIDDVVKQTRDSVIRAIKIDIEGAELPALRGASSLLAAHHPLLVIECDDELQASFGYQTPELIDFLDNLGYSVSPLQGTYSPTIVARFC